ncbi:MAG: PilT/PilU family type 4a pilus ATPase [Gammaproteobacteria bacterium]|nr:PilT/PilU family type 4a pilus ATPase [Gammaproteobacteria bacterium]
MTDTVIEKPTASAAGAGMQQQPAQSAAAPKRANSSSQDASQMQVKSSAQMGDPLALLTRLIQYAVAENASDIHIRVKNHPVVRIDGTLQAAEKFPVMSVSDLEALAQKIMSPRQWDIFQNKYQVDLSVGIKGIGRVRTNCYYQRGTIAMAFRVIRTDIPGIEELGLPESVLDYANYERGLILLTGATGSGKSSTIASLIDQINHKHARHVITIEDPIEFLFKEDRSIISQRELGMDAVSFLDAMTAALREDPDVILLGEMRDPDTIQTALTAAETGHLVFSTVHSPAAAETITRIVATFSPEAQPTIRAKLSQNLRAVVSQRLLPTASGKGRALACEIMNVSSRVRELILDPLKVEELADLVKKGEVVEGMLSFDQHLFQLCKQGIISEEVALQHASSTTDLKLKLEGFV